MKVSEMKQMLGDVLVYSVEDGEFEVVGNVDESLTEDEAIRMVVEHMNAAMKEVASNVEEGLMPADPERDAGDLDNGLTIFHPNGCQTVICVSSPRWRMEGLWVPNDEAATGEQWRGLSVDEAHELALYWIDPETGVELP